jgi:hypothetical protein
MALCFISLQFSSHTLLKQKLWEVGKKRGFRVMFLLRQFLRFLMRVKNILYQKESAWLIFANIIENLK